MTTGESSSQASAPSRTEILVDDSADDRRPPAKRQPPAETVENDSKRSKAGGRTWLKFHGRRQTRVGDAYQVNTLPQPCAYTVESGTSEP
jgi:hypothetical protein